MRISSDLSQQLCGQAITWLDRIAYLRLHDLLHLQQVEDLAFASHLIDDEVSEPSGGFFLD